MTEESSSTLLRAVGRWGLAALMLNTMVGASIFGLPALIAARLGNRSPLAYLVGAAAVAVIAACLSEVASQFSDAGGPYLYARAAFGRFTAIQIGWLTWLSRIAASSGVANLFISYLGELVPAVKGPVPRVAILTILVAILAAVNYRGVTGGSHLSNFFTVTKLLLLLLFVSAGCVAILLHPSIRLTQPSVPTTSPDWFDAVILMIYAYGGFEAALFIAGEARNPRKDAPAALLIALSTATLLYILVQYVVIHTVPNAGASTAPTLDAARRFLGPAAVWVVGTGVLLSAYGSLSANMLHIPRLTFAMADQGDFPPPFASIHPRFHTPAFSIVAYAVLLLVFSSLGDFRWNATLGAMSRLFIYGSVAAALPALRRQNPHADAFRLPAGNLFALLALLITATLVTRLHLGDLIILIITFAIGFINWAWTRRPPSTGDTPA